MIFIILSEILYSLLPSQMCPLFIELEYDCNYNLNLLNKINVFSPFPLYLETKLQRNVSLFAINVCFFPHPHFLEMRTSVLLIMASTGWN